MCAESLTFTFIQTQRPLLTPNSTTATRRRRGVNGLKIKNFRASSIAPLRFSAKGCPVILVHQTRDGSPQKKVRGILYLVLCRVYGSPSRRIERLRYSMDMLAGRFPYLMG